MENRDLFENIGDTEGTYSAHAHLARMTALLGPAPTAIVELERICRNLEFDPPVRSPGGKLCKNACQYFDGPFFDDKGMR